MTAPMTPRMIELENNRQRRHAEARAVSELTGHSQDYHRLPKPLRGIVDAWRYADAMFLEASEAARSAEHVDGISTEQWSMLTELERLAYHTREELERHGVVEMALAWLAAHPVGWDDEPDDQAERNPEAELAELRSEYRPEDDSRYQLDDAEIQARAEAQAEMNECEAARTSHCYGCKEPFKLGNLCEQWEAPTMPVRSLCAICSYPAKPAKRLQAAGYTLRIGYTIPPTAE